jgi:hypothetical protein
MENGPDAVIRMGGEASGQKTSLKLPLIDATYRIVLDADNDWLFQLGAPPGADKPDFDDSAWRTLDVPHDWSIEEPFAPSNPSGPAGGYATCGIGWYRRHFNLPYDFAGKRISPPQTGSIPRKSGSPAERVASSRAATPATDPSVLHGKA